MFTVDLGDSADRCFYSPASFSLTMLPILVGLGAVTALAVARAALRARTRLNQLPPSYFGVIDMRGPDPNAPFALGGFAETMSYNEALQVLGLPKNPSKAQLAQQHRKVIAANHPDRGGSTYMALKINEARSIVQKNIR